MGSEKLIDVIIPAYKAQNTILRTLSSIATQDILEDLDVVICNDADGVGYKKFVDMFKPYMNVKEIKLDTNGGPGVARQHIIDTCTTPLITFVDADDTFSNAFALRILRTQLLAEPQNACCWASFVEEQPNVFLAHNQDTVWLFAKLYKSEFLKRYNICFPPDSRSNEDGAFNTLCRLCSNEREQIKFIPDIVYYWHFKPDSITRIDNCNYSYNRSFTGFTSNQIWAIKEAEKRVPFNGQVMQHKVVTLCNLYEYFLETQARDPRYEEQNWNSCRQYYREIYREIKDKINDDILAACYSQTMQNCYVGQKMTSIIPKIGFKEFLAKLEQECQEEDKKENKRA